MERNDDLSLDRGAGFGALIAALCLYVFFAWLKTGQDYLQLVHDTRAKQARAAELRAEHDRALVQTYEPALAACLNGRGFVTDRAAVLCNVSQISGAGR